MRRINLPDCYFNSVCEELRPKRDRMAQFLQDIDVIPTLPEAGYFMVADFSNLGKYSTTVAQFRDKSTRRCKNPAKLLPLALV